MTIVILVLTACGGNILSQPDQTSTASGPTDPTQQSVSTPTATEVAMKGTISVWHSLQDPELSALLRQISAFQTTFTQVQFDVTYIPAIDLRASYEQAALDGRAPSVLLGAAEWGPGLFDQGLIADLTPYADEGVLNGLNPGAVDSAQYKDAQIGIPLVIDGVVLYRNRNIIPQAPATFEEMISLSKIATEGQTIGAVLDRGFYYTGGHLMGLGGSLMDADGNPAFNDQKGVEWMDLLLDLEDAGPGEFYADSDLQLFKEGRLGFMTEGTWKRQELAEAIGAENLAIDPWPIYKDGALAGFVQAENMYLSQHAMDEDPGVAWMFVQSMITPEAQQNFANIDLIPAIDPTKMFAQAGDPLDIDPHIIQAMTALRGNVAYPVNPVMSIYTPNMDIALQSIFSGEASLTEALQRAFDAIQLELAAIRGIPNPVP